MKRSSAFHIEPQRSTNLDLGDLPKPGFL